MASFLNEKRINTHFIPMVKINPKNSVIVPYNKRMENILLLFTAEKTKSFVNSQSITKKSFSNALISPPYYMVIISLTKVKAFGRMVWGSILAEFFEL